MPFYFLLSALWVAVDQVVKYLVRTYIPLYASVPFLPGMDLTYVQNTGAAFSLLSEHTWVLTLLSAVVSVGWWWPWPSGSSPLVGDAVPGPAAGGRRGQPHRPGAAWLCHRHV